MQPKIKTLPRDKKVVGQGCRLKKKALVGEYQPTVQHNTGYTDSDSISSIVSRQWVPTKSSPQQATTHLLFVFTYVVAQGCLQRAVVERVCHISSNAALPVCFSRNAVYFRLNHTIMFKNTQRKMGEKIMSFGVINQASCHYSNTFKLFIHTWFA